MHQEHAAPSDLAAALAGGGVHVVCFADIDAPSTTSLLAAGAGLDETERNIFCERVNTEDATGCLWPIARLSALPARFAAPAEDGAGDLRRCLARVVELNAALCKCPLMILDLRAAGGSAGQVEALIRELLAAAGEASLVQELRVVVHGIA